MTAFPKNVLQLFTTCGFGDSRLDPIEKLLTLTELRVPSERGVLWRRDACRSNYADILASLKSHEPGLLTSKSCVIARWDSLVLEVVSRHNKHAAGKGSLLLVTLIPPLSSLRIRVHPNLCHNGAASLRALECDTGKRSSNCCIQVFWLFSYPPIPNTALHHTLRRAHMNIHIRVEYLWPSAMAVQVT